MLNAKCILVNFSKPKTIFKLLQTIIMLNKILIVLSLFLVGKTAAQDPHFSLYQTIPVAVNPAYTGLIPGGVSQRFTANYRNQWSNLFQRNTFQTAYAAYDTRLCVGGGNAGFFGIGGQLLHDRAGSVPLERTQALVSVSYSMRLGPLSRISQGNLGDVRLTIGGEGGGLSHRIGGGEMRFDEQFDGRQYDPSVPGEEFDRYHFLMGDLGAGLLLHTSGKEATDFGFSVGGSYKHLNTPEYRFFDNDRDAESRLPQRLALHVSGKVRLVPDRTAVNFRGIFLSQGPFQQIVVGTDFLWRFGKVRGEDAVFTPGLSWRRSRHVESGWHDDALIAAVQLDMRRYRLVFGYDFSVSSVRRVSNSGGFEVGLQWVFDGGRDCGAVCPWGM